MNIKINGILLLGIVAIAASCLSGCRLIQKSQPQLTVADEQVFQESAKQTQQNKVTAKAVIGDLVFEISGINELGLFTTELIKKNTKESGKQFDRSKLEEHVIEIRRGTDTIVLPFAYASMTDAQFITINDGDTVSIKSWDAVLENRPERNSLISKLLNLKTKDNKFLIEKDSRDPNHRFTQATKLLEYNTERKEFSYLDLTIEVSGKGDSKLADALKDIRKQAMEFIAKNANDSQNYTVSGLVQNPGKIDLESNSVPLNRFLENRVPKSGKNYANVILLTRESKTIVLPLLRKLRSGTIPEEVQNKMALDGWQKETYYIQKGDSFLCTQLAGISFIVEGKRRAFAKKIEEKIKSGKKEEQRQLQLLRKEIDSRNEALRKSEPGLIRKSLRQIPARLPKVPNSLPRLNLPKLF